MKKITAAIIVTIALVAGLAFALSRSGTLKSGNNSYPATASAPGIPEIKLLDYKGQTVHLKNFAGVPLVINSWAAWCPFCGQELRDFAAAQEEFGDRVTIIAIDRAEPLSTAKEFSDQLGITEKLILLLDPQDSFHKSIGGFSMPETIFISKNGSMRFHKRGPMNIDEIRQRIQDILQ